MRLNSTESFMWTVFHYFNVWISMDFFVSQQILKFCLNCVVFQHRSHDVETKRSFREIMFLVKNSSYIFLEHEAYVCCIV